MTNELPSAARRSWLLWLPVMVFGVVMGFGAWKLTQPADTAVRSALIGQPMPTLDLPAAIPDRPTMTPKHGEGPRIINLFASWCVPCRLEAPQLEALAKDGVPVDGIAIHDTTDALRSFLDKAGDPYLTIVSDTEGAAQIALGSSGVPESYIVDGRGIVRYQHVGPIMPQDLATLRAQLAKAR